MLIEAAQARWRAVNAPHLVALARAGARFEAGKLVEHEPRQRDRHPRGDTDPSRIELEPAPQHRSMMTGPDVGHLLEAKAA